MTDYRTLAEIDARMRAISSEAHKLRAEVLRLAARAGDKDRPVALTLQRLDHIVSLTEAPGLTRYRQDEAAARPPVEHCAPEDLRCKLCGEEKESHEFFFDDGQGNYGYTGRCASCRDLPKHKRARIAAKRGLDRSERARAIGG